MWDVMTRPFILIVVAALGYSVATVAMKTVSTAPGFLPLLSIVACMTAAVMAEVLLLRTVHLGWAYIVILGTETVLILAAAAAMGEGFGPRDMAGVGLVLAGAGLMSI